MKFETTPFAHPESSNDNEKHSGERFATPAEESSERRFEVGRKEIYGMLAGGMLALCQNCMASGIDQTSDDVVKEAENPYVTNVIEKLSAGVEGECDEILHEEFKDISRKLPHEWALNLVERDGRWYLATLDEGQEIGSSLGFIRDDKEGEIKEVCAVHSHPLETVSAYYEHRVEHPRFYGEIIPEDERMSQEVVEEQEDLMKKGVLPPAFQPPSPTDIESVVFRQELYERKEEAGQLPALEDHAMVVAGPNGMWKLTVVPGSESDLDTAEPMSISLWKEKYDDVLKEYMEIFKDGRIAGPYSKDAFFAYQKGDKAAVMEEYQRRQAYMQKFQDLLGSIGITLTFTPYGEDGSSQNPTSDSE